MSYIPTEPGIELLTLLIDCQSTARKLADFAGLTPDEVFCLFVLLHHKPRNVKQLSNTLCVRGSRTSKLLYSLEEQGYVTRAMSLSDHRMEEVSLTPRGTDLIGRVLVFAREIAAGRCETVTAAGTPRDTVARHPDS